MPETLRLGSSGPLVKDLQEKLNGLPSKLPRLFVDAVFGMQTKSRVVEFQSQNALTADGVVGPLTWETLIKLLSAVGADVQNNLGRTAVLAVARAEAMLGGVSAKLSGGPDPKNPKLTFRQGHERLLKYFRLAAPKPGAINQTYYSEHNIRYLIVPFKVEPMPHWCGIFALWAIKTALVPVGTWIDGNGIGSVTGFKLITKTSAAPGDVGYVGTPFQHHFLIEQVYVQSGVKRVKTIEGNSSPSSNFGFQDRPLSTLDAVYSCFEPAKVFVAQPNDAYAY